MTEFAMIDYLVNHGWQMIDNEYFLLEGRTQNPVDLPLAFVIQRHLERVRHIAQA